MLFEIKLNFGLKQNIQIILYFSAKYLLKIFAD